MRKIRVAGIILISALVIGATFYFLTLDTKKIERDTEEQNKIQDVGEEVEDTENISNKILQEDVVVEEYNIPEDIRFDVSVELHEYRGMQSYILNQQENPEHIMFYFHGGAYIEKPFHPHWIMMNTLAKNTNVQIVAPIYPKAPSYTAPEVYEFLVNFYYDCLQEINYGKVSFMGDSAGGGMALALAQKLKAEKIEGPDALILLSPWLDISMDNEEMELYQEADPFLDRASLKEIGEIWAGQLDIHDYLVSPIYGNFENLGHITMFVGTHEIFYPDIVKLSDLLNEKNIENTLVIGEGMTHVYPIYLTPEGEEALAIVEEILKK